MPKSSRVHVVKAGHPAQANPKGDNPSSHNSSPISVYQCLSVFIDVHLWFICGSNASSGIDGAPLVSQNSVLEVGRSQVP